jgi:tRNA-dihydrouridine synthase B
MTTSAPDSTLTSRTAKEELVSLPDRCVGGKILALAPMQDITDLPFWRLMMKYGGADLYLTEYFRVHATSTLNRDILASIVENPTSCPVIAQMIGEDIPALVRTAHELQQFPIAGIDLNLGCPAPIVCRKNVAGGLLRDPERLKEILRVLRGEIEVPFSVKTRLGYESATEFDQLLEIYARSGLDLVSIHGRTVKQMYRGEVNYDRIAQAAKSLDCPVLANGDIDSAEKAVWVLGFTGAAGVMVGRAAVRNPWLFAQIRQLARNEPLTFPTGRQFSGYLHELFAAVGPPVIQPRAHIEKLKKYLNFIGPGLEQADAFLYSARRMISVEDFEELCRRFLAHEQPLRLQVAAGWSATATEGCSA